MPVGYLQARKGVRLQGPVVDVVAVAVGAAAANPIFQQSTYLPAIVGTRTFRIKRIKGLNQLLANTLVHIATTALGDVIPPLQTFAGLNFDFVEADLPEVEINADLLAWALLVTAENPITIQVEVEELG